MLIGSLVLLTVVISVRGQIETVKITGGEVQGTIKDGIGVFKGIPFAAPPLGELRWKAPQPVSSWNGVRKADSFGPNPMQDVFLAALMSAPANFSEDCLYLNVWTPAKKADEKLPVMVWIYGGAFISGMTSAPMYDGTKLAQKGVVFVSVAYRLGPFGFLAHPELSKESGKGSGCYGILDQVAGLEWVKNNIAQFGGDPNRVTTFGESAGGISVSMLTAVPSAKGLFQRAISQSGGSMGPIKTDHEISGFVPSLKMAEENGRVYLEKLGARDIKSARALSAETIQKGGVTMGAFWPVADGDVLPGDQYELYKSGKFNDTPVLIGFNSDEGAMFVRPGATPETFQKQVRENFGPWAETMLQLYPHSTEAEAFKSSKEMFREAAFAWQTYAWALLHSEKGSTLTYVYYFDLRTPMRPDGANHAAELGYVFGNLGGPGGVTKDDDKALSELMRSYWVNFATTGNPNGAGLPQWPTFTTTNMNTFYFDRKPSARPIPNLEKLKAFDRFYAWRREQDKAK